LLSRAYNGKLQLNRSDELSQLCLSHRVCQIDKFGSEGFFETFILPFPLSF